MTIDKNMKTVRASTVKSYSAKGSMVYDDPMNKNFLYGEITMKFLDHLEFSAKEKVVLDLGCGTGFIFEYLFSKFSTLDLQGIGIEPAIGMLEMAIKKHKNEKRFTYYEGSFETIPLENGSVDKIVSTLALHWVKSLSVAAQEMKRVLRDDGNLHILMIAKDDGEQFKKAIVSALRKHLTFSQIMDTAVLVQRASPQQVKKAFAPYFEGFDIQVEKFTDIVYGSFEDHMKWWKARSSPVIAEVNNKDKFIGDLQVELEKIQTIDGIPFDTAYLWIKIRKN
jgi:ubiquinone/menaquinone biosynthesis C-methylase UbiE|tara:strand:+ start:174 stop:1013 length:840 start_codon:yes stop_codon:yes gene_type:complete